VPGKALTPTSCPRYGRPAAGAVAFRDKKYAGQRFARHGAVLLEIGDAFAGQKAIVDQKMAGEALGRFQEDREGRIRHDLRRARHAHHAVAAQQIVDRRGGNGGARPKCVDGNALAAKLAGKPERH